MWIKSYLCAIIFFVRIRNITDIALEKYPPKGMADPQGWEHDENAELRRAFMQGYECSNHTY